MFQHSAKLFGGVVEEEQFVREFVTLPFQKAVDEVEVGWSQLLHLEAGARSAHPVYGAGEEFAPALGVAVGIVLCGFQDVLLEKEGGIVAHLGLAQPLKPHVLLTVDVFASREIAGGELTGEIGVDAVVGGVRLLVHLDGGARGRYLAYGDARHFPVHAEYVADELPAKCRQYPAFDDGTLASGALPRASVEIALFQPLALELDDVGDVALADAFHGGVVVF